MPIELLFSEAIVGSRPPDRLRQLEDRMDDLNDRVVGLAAAVDAMSPQHSAQDDLSSA